MAWLWFGSRKLKEEDLEVGIVRLEYLEKQYLTALVNSVADTIARAVVSGGVMLPPTTTYSFEYGVIKQLYLTAKALVLFGDAFYEKKDRTLYWVPNGTIEYELGEDGYEYKLVNMIGKEGKVDKDVIVHFQMPDVNMKGNGLIGKLGAEIHLDKYMMSSLVGYYKNAMYPRYLISVEDAGMDEIKNLEHRLNDLYFNAPNGMFLVNKKVNKVELKADLPIEQTQKMFEFLGRRVSAFSGVPLHRLGLAQFDENEERRFYREVVRVYQEVIEDTLQEQCRLKIEFMPQAKGLNYIDELVEAVQNGILTPNEARHILGLPPVESDGADDLILITPKGKEDLGEGGDG